jgi:hypothetical protein
VSAEARKLIFFLLAAPAVARASARVTWLVRRLTLEELADRLRSVPPFRLRPLRDPSWMLACLDRLLPLLPPRSYGTCMRRSLLLLDLWSRCGLRPRLHLGIRRGGEGVHEGHAWVSASAGEGEPGPATSAQGYPEAFRF